MATQLLLHLANPVIDVLSYGGGLDSWTMLHKAVIMGMKIDLVIFADVGDHKDRSVPGEWPSTYRHIDEVAKPFCAEHGIEFVTLTSDYYPLIRKGIEYRSIFEYGTALNQFFASQQHTCTVSGKIDRITRYLDERYPDRDVCVWIGFTAGEEKRAARDPRGPNAKIKHQPGKARRRSRYPLVEWGFCRCREEAYCRGIGYPVPRKSACVFCPKASRKDFMTLKAELPETFELVAEYERNSKITGPGKRLRFSGTDSPEAVKADRADVPVLNDWIEGRLPNGKQMRPFKYKRIPCHVCGAEQHATKATGCDYLSNGNSCAA